MLKHPTGERLIALGLKGMAQALEEQRAQPDIADLDFEERLGLLVDREATARENKRLVSRLLPAAWISLNSSGLNFPLARAWLHS
jgi:hypothetical protein